MFHCEWTCMWVRSHHQWCVSINKKGMLLQCNFTLIVLIIIIHWKLLWSVRSNWNQSSMLPCDFCHVFTHPHTQHLHLHTSVLTKKREEHYLRMFVTTLFVWSCVLSRMVQIPLSWLQEINICTSSATLQTRAGELVISPRRSHSGETQADLWSSWTLGQAYSNS